MAAQTASDPAVFRPIASFAPSIWGNRFITLSLDHSVYHLLLGSSSSEFKSFWTSLVPSPYKKYINSSPLNYSIKDLRISLVCIAKIECPVISLFLYIQLGISTDKISLSSYCANTHECLILFTGIPEILAEMGIIFNSTRYYILHILKINVVW